MKLRGLVLTMIPMLFTACAGGLAPQPYAGTLPVDTALDMSGSFTLTPTGELQLALSRPCTYHMHGPEQRYADVPCDRSHRDPIRVVAVSPSLTATPGVWRDADHLTFQIDWAHAGFDPLARTAGAMSTRPWEVSGTQWIPNESEGARVLQLVGDATGNEPELIRGGEKPNLEVTSVEPGSGGLHAGERGSLTVKITNRGPGVAYRVAVTTRSSVESLHGRQVSFGRLKPGESKLRQLEVEVPASESAPDTMLVLSVSEGNGAAPPAISRRIAIAASLAAPVLRVRCAIADHPEVRPELASASEVTVQCKVNNTGTAAAKVEIDTKLGDGAPSRVLLNAGGVNSWAINVAPGAQVAAALPVKIPRELPIDAPAELVVVAADHGHARVARTALTVMVRKPRLCEPGKLTRAQYHTKIAGLRELVASGDMTQAQLDRYDTELVSCLN